MTGLVAALGLTSCSQGNDPPPDVGATLVDARPTAVEGSRLWVQIPSGQVGLTIGEPVTVIPAAEAAGPNDITAADNELFLPYEVDVSSEGMPRGLGFRFDDTEQEAQLAVRVGEHEHQLGTPSELGSVGYLRVVASEAEVSEVELIAEFDGVIQRVDATGRRDAGSAAALYERAWDEIEGQPCADGWAGGAGSPEVRAELTCVMYAAQVPYLPGHGWADQQEPGHAWAVVAVTSVLESAELVRPDGTSRECPPSGPGTGGVELDGLAPAAAQEVRSVQSPIGSSVMTAEAFLIPESASGSLRIRRSSPCRDGGDWRDLELSTTVEVTLGPEPERQPD